MSEEKAQVPEPGPPILTLESVLRLVDDWEADYITPVSFPVNVGNHIHAAVGQLKARLKGLG